MKLFQFLTAKKRYSANKNAFAPREIASEMSTTFLLIDVSTSPSSPIIDVLMLVSAKKRRKQNEQRLNTESLLKNTHRNNTKPKKQQHKKKKCGAHKKILTTKTNEQKKDIKNKNTKYLSPCRTSQSGSSTPPTHATLPIVSKLSRRRQ